jgi:hypothetical protein
MNPFGMRPIRSFVGVQPGVLRWEGRPAGEPGSYNRELGDLSDALGWGALNGTRAVNLWLSGPQSVTAIDVAVPEIAGAWADLVVRHFGPWAYGIHADYWTDLAWIDRSFPREYWDRWNAGLVTFGERIKGAGFKLLGQQFHLTPITHVLDGLYVEQSPGHFGLSFVQHAENMKRHGHPENWVFELREPSKFPAWYVRQTIEFVREHGAILSPGRDASALLLGLP